MMVRLKEIIANGVSDTQYFLASLGSLLKGKEGNRFILKQSILWFCASQLIWDSGGLDENENFAFVGE